MNVVAEVPEKFRGFCQKKAIKRESVINKIPYMSQYWTSIHSLA